MLPEDDRVIETCRRVFKCFNVNFRLLKLYIYIYIHTYIHVRVCVIKWTNIVCVRVCVCVCVCKMLKVSILKQVVRSYPRRTSDCE